MQLSLKKESIDKIFISFVLPVFNERGNIKELYTIII